MSTEEKIGGSHVLMLLPNYFDPDSEIISIYLFCLQAGFFDRR